MNGFPSAHPHLAQSSDLSPMTACRDVPPRFATRAHSVETTLQPNERPSTLGVEHSLLPSFLFRLAAFALDTFRTA